jgi:hypothetical protein
MVLGNRICNICNHKWIVSKQDLENWSELQFECPECGSMDTRTKFGMGDFDVSVGKTGNASTGYSNEFIKQPSKYGYFKGKKV